MLQPAEFATLTEVGLDHSVGCLKEVTKLFRACRSAGCWAMYKNESVTTESLVASTMVGDELGLQCLSALALTGEDGF